jgi:FkbM family methyltransferase
MDIGAHMGLFSVVMARLVGPTGRVYSFEPTPLSRKVLERAVRINGCAGIVEVRPKAVAGATGKAVLYDTGPPASNANSLVRSVKSKSGITLEEMSLDDFVTSRQLNVTCLKIDVEGAELELLRGARRTLLTCRPAMLLSIHPMAIHESGGSLTDIWQLLQDCGMSVRLPEGVHEARPDAEAIGSGWLCEHTNFLKWSPFLLIETSVRLPR